MVAADVAEQETASPRHPGRGWTSNGVQRLEIGDDGRRIENARHDVVLDPLLLHGVQPPPPLLFTPECLH